MGLRRHTAGTNESIEAVPVFGLDPHGAAMFAGITNGTLGHLGTRPVIDAQRAPWHGWTAPPQAMRGAGNIGAGRAIAGPGPRLDQERGTLAPDSIQTLFQDRMTSRRFG